jgi:hypothetical protein
MHVIHGNGPVAALAAHVLHAKGGVSHTLSWQPFEDQRWFALSDVSYRFLKTLDIECPVHTVRYVRAAWRTWQTPAIPLPGRYCYHLTRPHHLMHALLQQCPPSTAPSDHSYDWYTQTPPSYATTTGQSSCCVSLVTFSTTYPAFENTLYEWFLPNGCIAILPEPSPQRYTAVIMGQMHNDALRIITHGYTYHQHTLMAPIMVQTGWTQPWFTPYRVLLGNAAHRMHPLGAQGLNQTIADLIALQKVPITPVMLLQWANQCQKRHRWVERIILQIVGGRF